MRRGPQAPTIADLMVIIAAVAAGLGLGRSWVSGLASEISGFAILPPSTHARTQLAARGMSLLIPATIGVLALRIRRPLPRVRLLAREPGSVACLASLIGLGLAVMNLRMDLRTMGKFLTPLLVSAWYWPGTIGSAVLASWVLMVVGRGWHPSDWVDRVGILVGLGWVGLLPLLWIVEFV